MLRELVDSMPKAMQKSFKELPNKHKVEFIISGLGSDSYIEQWQYIYIKACRFIHNLYRERAKSYKRLAEVVML